MVYPDLRKMEFVHFYLLLSAGDEIKSFVDRKGVISIINKYSGAAKGLLKGIKVKTESELKSLESAA